MTIKYIFIPILAALLLAAQTTVVLSESTSASKSGEKEIEADESNETNENNLEDIKENVKKRIQGVIENKSNQIQNEVAFGKLTSVVTNTLSLDTDTGIKLASTSGETLYVRLPGNTKITPEDLAIDEYLIVVGALNDKQVINATKVVSQKAPPTEPSTKTAHGIIYTYDPKKFILTIENPQTNAQQDYLLGRKSNIYLANPDGTKSQIDRKQDLPVQSQVLILYEPPKNPEDDIVITEMLVIPSSPVITPAELIP